MAQYDRFRDTALRLITKYGEKIQYVQVLDGEAVEGKSWIVTEPQKIVHTVSAVFFSSSGSAKDLFRMMQGGDVQTGNEIAYLPTLNFTPSLKDILIRSDGKEIRIESISPIKPNDEASVLYKMELQA